MLMQYGQTDARGAGHAVFHSLGCTVMQAFGSSARELVAKTCRKTDTKAALHAMIA